MTANHEIITSVRPLLPIAVAFASPFVIRLLAGNRNRREAVSFVASGLTSLLVLLMVPAILEGKIYKYTLFTIMPGISISFCADGLSMVFALVSSLLWIFTTSYNIGYMRSLDAHAQTRYYMCFAVAILGAQGVAFAGNLVTLYLFYEIITFFTYPLVAHHQDEAGYAAGKKYLVYLVGASKLFFLPALVITYLLCGTLDFHLGDIERGIFPPGANPKLVIAVYILLIAGLAKAAIMPLHNWLPSAMVAPTPVSALLHAVAVVKAGVFSICRIMLSLFGLEALDIFGLGPPTTYVAAFTILAAAVIAISKDDLKAVIAYSTVSQLSYIIMGVAMLTPETMAGGISYIAHHSFPKIALFFASGSILVVTGFKKISQMSGLGRRMPWTFGAFALASLSFIAIAPVSGFISRFYLVTGAAEAGRLDMMAVILTTSLLNLAFLGPIVYKGFFRPPPPEANEWADYSEAPLTMVIPTFAAAVISVLVGFYPQTFLCFVNKFGGFSY